MDASQDRLDIGAVAMPAFVVLVAAFAGMRLLGIDPWDLPAFDVYAYWATRDGFDYATARQGVTGAYLYSPAFAQAISPLTALPWQAFAGIWTAIAVAPLLWLAGRYAALLVVAPPIFMSVALGQLDLLFALVVIIGFRWPAAWALPILTKVTPGIGLLWFLVRGEWRSLGIALGATLAIAAASFALAPGSWVGWLAMLGRQEFPSLGGELWFVPVPLLLRLPLAAALVAWGARTDRPWCVPVAVCISLPTVWLNAPTILVALLPLAAAGARTPAGAWLRAKSAPTQAGRPRPAVRARPRRVPASSRPNPA